jgi:uncharacterized protein (TIRG00374 family)
MVRRLGPHILIAIGLLALVSWQGKVWKLPETVQGLDWRVALAVLALNIPIVALWVLRSYWVLAKLGYRLPLISLIGVTTVGNVAGALTPGGAGDVLRGVALKNRHEVPGHVAASAVLYERLYVPILMILSLAAVGALSILSDRPLVVGLVLAACLATAVGCVRLYALLAPRFRPVASGNGRIPWKRWRWTRWLGSLGEVNEVLALLFSDLRLAFRFTLLTLAVYILTTVQVWLLLDAAGGSASGAQAWLAYGTASLAGMLSLLPGGVGIWDATLSFVLAGHGVEIALAITTTLLLRALSTLPLGLLAVASYAHLAHGRPVAAQPLKRKGAWEAIDQPERIAT